MARLIDTLGSSIPEVVMDGAAKRKAKARLRRIEVQVTGLSRMPERGNEDERQDKLEELLDVFVRYGRRGHH